MLYEVGLLCTVAVGAWLALELLVAELSRRDHFAIAALGFSTALFAAGELLIELAAGPEERLFARRMLFLGTTSLAPTWLAVAIHTARPRWFDRHPDWLRLSWIAPIFFYSCLYWDRSGLFVGWTPPEPSHGPLFPWFAGHQWVLVTVGYAYFLGAARRMGRASPLHMAMLTAGTGLPLVANMLYVGGLLPVDPTPVALGPGALLIRLAVVDSGWTLHLPLARSAVIEQLDVGIAVADLEGRVLDTNRAAHQLSGVLRGRATSVDDLARSAADRRDAAIETRRIPLRSRMGEVGSALLISDRSEAESAQRRLRLAARLEAVGSLTAGIAHEVNNPLAYIQANLTQLEKTARALATPEFARRLPPELAEQAREATQIVGDTQDGVARIGLLVQRLKSFAGTDDARLRVAPLDLDAAVARAVEMASVKLRPGAIRIRDGGVDPVATCENALGQILLNLLLNAVQAGGEEADIEVSVSPDREAAGARIDVMDRGPGFADDDLAQIFDPFFTTRADGTGLGLSLSYDLARQLGGRLEAANREGGGAVFSLWLPAAPE